MSVTSGFFNAINGDRTYSAEQFGEIFDGVISDGLIPEYLGCFNHTYNSEVKVIHVGPGRAWFRHRWIYNSNIFDVTIPDTSSENLKRLDYIVIKIDNSSAVRSGGIELLMGTESTNPVAPELENTEDVLEIPIYSVLSSSEGIEETHDLRGSILCPYCTPLISKAGGSGILIKSESSFSGIETQDTAFWQIAYTEGADKDSPLPEESGEMIWNVINICNENAGYPDNVTQIAFVTYPNVFSSSMWFRQCGASSGGHVSYFTDWFEFNPYDISSLRGDFQEMSTKVDSIGTTYSGVLENSQTIPVSGGAINYTEFGYLPEHGPGHWDIPGGTIKLKGWYLVTMSCYINLHTNTASGRIYMSFSVSRGYSPQEAANNERTLNVIHDISAADYFISGASKSVSKVVYFPDGDHMYDYIDLNIFSDNVDVPITMNPDNRYNFYTVTKLSD